MKHIYNIIMYACVGMLLAGCASDDGTGGAGVTPVAKDEPVSFSTIVGESAIISQTQQQGETRATIGTIDNLDALKASGDGFGVFAYLTDNKNWTAAKTDDDDLSEFKDFFMYNQQVTWGVQWVENGSDEDPTNDVPHYDWVYSPLKYWPNSSNNAENRNISFFAYAPYTAQAGAEKGITGFTDSSDKLPHIIYEIAGGNEQVDLLYANCIDATRNGNGLISVSTSGEPAVTTLTYEKVPLTFSHALAAIDIYVQRIYDEPVYTGNSPAEANDTKLYISKLELASATDGENSLQTGGRLNLETGEWTSVGSTWSAATGKKLTYTEAMFDDHVKGTTSEDNLIIRGTELEKFSEESGVDATERILINNGMPQVFLPRRVTLIPTVTYSMVTQDDDLAIGYYTDQKGQKYSRIVNTVTGNSMTIDFQAGKRYKVLIRIGVEHITFAVEDITDWDFPLRYNPSVLTDFVKEEIGHRLDEE